MKKSQSSEGAPEAKISVSFSNKIQLIGIVTMEVNT